MSKELEALEFIKNDLIAFWLNSPHLECPNEKDFVEGHYRLGIIENALKALEIIKEKRVDVGYLFNLMVKCNNDEKVIQTYNTMNVWTYTCGEKGFITDKTTDITQQEYDLLKEVLL